MSLLDAARAWGLTRGEPLALAITTDGRAIIAPVPAVPDGGVDPVGDAVATRLRADGGNEADVVPPAPGDAGDGVARSDRTWPVPAAGEPAVGGGIHGGRPPVAEGRLTDLGQVEVVVRPRWAVWSVATMSPLLELGVRPATAWDVSAVHRLLHGGWRADPARTWAAVHDLPTATMPVDAPLDLFNQGDETPDGVVVRKDGYLRPDVVAGGWEASVLLRQAWVLALAEVVARQRSAVDRRGGRVASTARSESVAELLCAELAHDGLPIDVGAAETIIGDLVGPRVGSEAEAAVQRAERDEVVLRHVPGGMSFDLRNPAQVKSLLRSVGVEVADTRAWRLETLRDAHPLVADLLEWRKAERIATTFGYAWLDDNVGPDGRLRGDWTGSDGAAGRMTASAGLHNMPALLRPAVRAEPGHVFVRADLGQIEPRVLAAVSGDTKLAAAAADDDMYLPVAAALDVDRATAKVAVLGAMYGQTTGHGAVALRRLESAYPVAMEYLAAADRTAQTGHDVFTIGGRRVRMGGGGGPDGSTGEGERGERDEREDRSRAAARGRYGRNAVVQGAAAELFKVWALTVRARGMPLEARIVLCLHDELLVHVPADAAGAARAMVVDALGEAAHRWHTGTDVRFVADVSVITRWSDAK